MRGLLEQKVPLQEFDVRNPFEFFIVWEFFDLYWVFKNICFSFSQNLQNLEPLDDCLIAQTKENRKKNRYKNVVPCKKNTYFLVYSPVLCITSGNFLKYWWILRLHLFLVDTTRVLLGKDGGYINANFIKMSVKDENYMYIACQGPLPTTLCDFWQMVLEQKSNVIAMMTREVEGGKVKCQRYWPDTPRTAEMVDDRLQITLLKDQYLDNFVIRLIEVKDVHVSIYSKLSPILQW